MNSDPINQWYIEHHICFVCRRENAEPNKQMCWECAEKSRAHQRKKYRQNRAANIADSSQRRRERKAKRLELGLCVECGKRPHDESHVTCVYCRKRELRHQKERRQKKARYRLSFAETAHTVTLAVNQNAAVRKFVWTASRAFERELQTPAHKWTYRRTSGWQKNVPTLPA